MVTASAEVLRMVCEKNFRDEKVLHAILFRPERFGLPNHYEALRMVKTCFRKVHEACESLPKCSEIDSATVRHAFRALWTPRGLNVPVCNNKQ